MTIKMFDDLLNNGGDPREISVDLLKNGGDPRLLPDYVALREELNKLSHPARPDVDWQQVEKRCLALFTHNGVELQSVAWYTLAKTHLAGINGLNEGLAVLQALLASQWRVLWPQEQQARIIILGGLSQRLQALFRTLSPARDDLQRLYETEKRLGALQKIALQKGMKQASKLDAFYLQVQQAVLRLENQPAEARLSPEKPSLSEKPAYRTEKAAGQEAPKKPDESVMQEALKKHNESVMQKTPTEHDRSVIQEAPKKYDRSVTPEASRPQKNHGGQSFWKPFAAGVLSALLLSGVALASWHYQHRQDNVERELIAMLAPVPAAPVLTAEARLRMQQHPEFWLERVTQQLESLHPLPVDWRQRYASQLVSQAQTLWPAQPEAARLQLRWQQQLTASALPEEALNGWYQGMQQLRTLAAKLDSLDGQKGRYLTVSELKSQVFSLMTHFGKSVPVEEELRQLMTSKRPLSPAAVAGVEQHLQQQLDRYTLLRESAE